MSAEDWNSLPRSADTPALVLFHGLEGGSNSRYAQSIAHHFRARGWIVAIAHFRGCSGVPNRLARAYYSGDSEEVGFMLDTVRQRIPQARWHAVGVSLGGNALLKYLGEHPDSTQWLAGAAGVSVPLDLMASGKALCQGFFARRIYTPYFLRTMKHKVLEKAKRFPGAIDVMRIANARDLRDFDDAYTAPMHGFRNALDYWARASSKPWLAKIGIPTLVLNARNDPFLPESALPVPAECADQVLLHQPAAGGHAGFPAGPFPAHLNWLPQRLGRFFETGK
ncbi:alpha/beta hydrolase fold family protein [Bordetella holmesii ATCC 51541]|nr:alpha/beta hydrolase fold family protein [Bordetella holmesii ATCC 51541]